MLPIRKDYFTMPVSLDKAVRTFTVIHQRGKVFHVVPGRAMLQPDGSLGPYAEAWQDMFARRLTPTTVEAVDRWAAVRAAAEEIGPYISERDWMLSRIDIFALNRSADPHLPIRERALVVDVVLESAFTPVVDPTGAPIVWEDASAEERRAWLDDQPTGVLLRWYRHIRQIHH
ncbi:hypothetical protein [Streptomyces griseocarneus]|uniref:hypothetical protein n=1 Tax=Streptomyces griseocarneus TaxID=51201 RepID=UPI00167CC204|nr:hypothetical protein [Streptomyces griseocarneus]MBZ6476752.1 hypothetical protein [Streptomyces griseocarneus]GHG80718.1 hypothetical protein GCM10018779_62520 [Streptomyces griseocarneus]